MHAISTHELTKRFGDVTAVEGIDLAVERGEVFGFLGPNGAGKSTTIDTLLDFVRPTDGRAELFDLDAQADADRISRRIGVLPDDFSLYDRLSGRRHVEFAIETKRADDDPTEILDRVGIDPADADRPAGDYSKGMAQRLAMGMALVGDPDLLIMDEPSSGLDPHGIREMQELVRAEADNGTTVFFSSHILEHVEAVCDRVGVLHEGDLVAVDTIDGLQESLGGGATVRVDLDRPVADAVERLSGIDGVSEVVASGRSVQVTCHTARAKAVVVLELEGTGATVEDLAVETASLESLFTTLTETGGLDAGGRRSGSSPPTGTTDDTRRRVTEVRS
ncbi:ABC transporter ATP-binding protein [Halovivax cerinus]|uniref:ABC transporter ATP-binding protein n=1 Tax=Halovivax cerinus TaxID=1487865 RepID=A0ABD5NKA5_9EURY|nr:ABC transporter ATP-binding protein [Halovivax cerinus]